MRFVIASFLLALTALPCCTAEDKAEPGKPAPPVGTWERTADGHTMTLTVKDGRLRLTLKADKGVKVLWLMEADYGITQDNLLFGIVTSLERSRPGAPGAGSDDAGPGGPGAAPGGFPGGASPMPGGYPGGGGSDGGYGGDPFSSGSAAGRLGLDLQIDDLFRFRFRVDDGVLTVKDTRARAGSSSLGALLPGRFKQAKVEDPKKERE